MYITCIKKIYVYIYILCIYIYIYMCVCVFERIWWIQLIKLHQTTIFYNCHRGLPKYAPLPPLLGPPASPWVVGPHIDPPRRQ